jgi:NO-binding membrane sensor protein with MHYT domain
MKLIGTYDIWLVSLSYIVSVLGSFTALELAGHVLEEKLKIKRLLWIVVAAVALGGGGVWSMHFIAMLAFKLPIAVSYDITLTVISLVAAVVVVGIGLFVVTGSDLSMVRLCAAGLFVGVGVCAMHYTGMAAMRMAAVLEYDPLIFTLSIVVAIVVATVGLLLMVTMRKGLHRVISSFVIAFAVCSMHYTAMFGTSCIPTFAPGDQDISVAMSQDSLAVAIAVGTFGILVLAWLLSLFGRRRKSVSVTPTPQPEGIELTSV